MRFDTRASAFKAMMLRDHLATLGVVKVTFSPEGHATFRKHGAWYTAALNPDGTVGVILMPIITSVPNQNQKKDLPTNADQFASQGNVWNADNYQHHAYDPRQKLRANAFGDLCTKPTVEGYDDADYACVMADRAAQMRAQALVRKNEHRREADFKARRDAMDRFRYRRCLTV